MICPYCKKEFSNSVYRLHLQRCTKNPKNIKETPKKKGK